MSMKVTLAEFMGPGPCPFCGGESQVMKMDLSALDEGWQLYGVWCIPDLHAEEHGGFQHGHYIDNYATASEAIEAWNSRASDREAELGIEVEQ